MRPPTPEQERALAAAAAQRSTAVAAGAGAGKTTLMVEAVWRDVEHHGVPLDRILVVAYNRAAAAHLVARLQSRFSDETHGRGRGRPGLDLSAAWVGTFHSLAARIVREDPFAAGVDPDFGELDEVEAQALAEQALDEAFERSSADPGLRDLVTAASGLDGLRDAILHVHERLRAAGQEAPRIRIPDARGPDDATVAGLRAAMDAVDSHPGARDDHREAVARAAEMIESGAPDAQGPPKASRNCVHALKPLCERFNDLAAAVRTALLDRDALPRLEGFARHLTEFAERYAEMKRARGALDYEDLLLAARRVLRAGHAYDFARVYVDEFQDANALQAEIVDLLAAERTVVVGDGCQAIYGFRHADSSHFARRTAASPGVGLRDNHRSQRPLLLSLNGLLGRVLADEPAFAPLTPAARPRPGPPLADPPLRIVDVASDDGAEPTRDQEAEATADVVEALVREDGYRPREVAVLFRALTAVEPYRAAISARGIPVHLVAGRGFFTHDQVADTIALLRLVENVHDEEALVRVLASPYVAAGDADLAALREAAGEPGKRWPMGGALWPAAAGIGGARAVHDLVTGLRPLLRERGLAGLTEAATAAGGYDLAVLGLPDGARRYANLRRLVRMAAEHSAVRGPDLRGFLRLLARMADEARQDPGEATLVDPELDAVRLSTVHAVKGQEFPAIVLADASHGLPSVYPMVVVDGGGRAGLRLPKVGGETDYVLGYDRIRRELMDADAAEERRILYVALTRAERHCAIVGRSAARNQGASQFRTLREALGSDEPGTTDLGDEARAALEEAWVAGRAGDDTRPRTEPSASHPVDAPAVPGPPAIDAAAGTRLSFSSLRTLSVCPRRFHLEVERGLRGRGDAVVSGGGGTGPAGAWGGTALGDLVHRALARHDWNGPGPAPGWAAALAADLGLPESEAEAARAEGMVARLLESDLAARIAAAPARHAERPFAIVLDGVLLSGAIDLLVEEADGRALLVDWKTHALGEGRDAEDVAREYALQRALYGLAAIEAGYREVALLWAVLDDLGAGAEETATAADRDRLREEVRACLAGVRAAGRAAAATTPQPFCTGCPGLDAMCPVATAAPEAPSAP